MNYLKYSCLVVVCVAVALAADSDADEKKDPIDRNSVGQDTNTQSSSSSSRSDSGDVVIPGHVISMLTQGGAVAAGVTALAALAMLVLPLFGIRVCSLFNTCDTTPYHGYSNSVYNDYPANYNQGTYNAPSYQKRSIEYVAPVLKALSTAYDKYNRQTVVKAQQVKTTEK